VIVFLILAYRLIPRRIRAIWSFGSSSSGLALALARDGHSTQALWRYAIHPAWVMIQNRGGGSWCDPRNV
jgi:hypothetical protein